VRDLLRRPVWPLVALLLLNLAVTPSFFAVRLQDGRLYGSLIDILHNGAPLALAALGMTLEIATTVPTDRSMPRVAITNVMPSATSASGAPLCRMSIRLP
jgi:simple sugar transport system permease protein